MSPTLVGSSLSLLHTLHSILALQLNGMITVWRIVSIPAQSGTRILRPKDGLPSKRYSSGSTPVTHLRVVSLYTRTGQFLMPTERRLGSVTMPLFVWKGTTLGSSKHITHPLDPLPLYELSGEVLEIFRRRAVKSKDTRSRTPETSIRQTRGMPSS